MHPCFVSSPSAACLPPSHDSISPSLTALSDLCVNRRHRQLTTNSARISPSGRQTVNKCILQRLWVRLMTQLTNTLSARVFLPDEIPSERVSSLATKQPSAQTLHAVGRLWAAGRRSKLLLTGPHKHKDLLKSSRIVAMFSQLPLIWVRTFTGGGLLVISGQGGRLHNCPAQVQTHTEAVMTGSKALCGYSVEFKCQSPNPAPSRLPLPSPRSPPVFVRVGD